MPVLDPGRGRTRTCQFWAHAIDDRPWGGPSPPAVAYVFADGRGTDKIAPQLAGFSGILQVDGYAAYKALARDHGRLDDPACVLFGACQAQIREGVQVNEVAVRLRGDASDCRRFTRSRQRDPRNECGTASGTQEQQDRTADGGAQGAADFDGQSRTCSPNHH